MSFYLFRQNNSGGHFHFDAKRGVSVEVWVEAEDADEANARAESLGLYFGGGGDCPCCGNRWHPMYGGPDQAEAPETCGGYTNWAEREGDGAAYGYLHLADGSFAALPFRSLR